MTRPFLCIECQDHCNWKKQRYKRTFTYFGGFTNPACLTWASWQGKDTSICLHSAVVYVNPMLAFPRTVDTLITRLYWRNSRYLNICSWYQKADGLVIIAHVYISSIASSVLFQSASNQDGRQFYLHAPQLERRLDAVCHQHPPHHDHWCIWKPPNPDHCPVRRLQA